jgi:hypothetical protein
MNELGIWYWCFNYQAWACNMAVFIDALYLNAITYGGAQPIASLSCENRTPSPQTQRRSSHHNNNPKNAIAVALLRRAKDFSYAKSEGEVLSEMCVTVGVRGGVF